MTEIYDLQCKLGEGEVWLCWDTWKTVLADVKPCNPCFLP